MTNFEEVVLGSNCVFLKITQFCSLTKVVLHDQVQFWVKHLKWNNSSRNTAVYPVWRSRPIVFPRVFLSFHDIALFQEVDSQPGTTFSSSLFISMWLVLDHGMCVRGTYTTSRTGSLKVTHTILHDLFPPFSFLSCPTVLFHPGSPTLISWKSRQLKNMI